MIQKKRGLRWSIWSAVLCIFFSTIMIVGWSEYPGRADVYIYFCSSFLLLLLLSGYGDRSWAYISLCFFWLLGFPIKLVTHLLSNTPYAEPIGSFNYSGSDYDHALTVTTCGVLGLLLAKVVLISVAKKRSQHEQVPTLRAPSKMEIVLYILVLCVLAASNMLLEIFQVGVAAQTVFPFKLTSLVFWAFNFGIASWLTFMLWRLPSNNDKINDNAVLLITGSAFILSISILSRSPFIFFAAPLLIVLWRKTRESSNLTFKKIGKHIVIFVIMFTISVALVSLRRAVLYESGVDGSTTQVKIDLSSDKGSSDKGSSDKGSSAFSSISKYFAQINLLFIDRWIGFEGVAAVSAYPARSWELFGEGVKESAAAGSAGVFQHIAKSPFASTIQLHSDRFIFGTEPGLIGFLYYSNQLWVVFAGVWAVGLLIMGIEKFASIATNRNSYFTAFVGVSLANLIMQFVTPRMHSIFVLELLATIAMLSLVHWRINARSIE